ncbi:MAG: YtxH domain-containing protein [Elusimicrobia bacterium]|nr:YtxH domain-containing protein [Candidatus Liberimonas magnetica]
MSDRNLAGVALAFIFGALAGAAAGVLFAPAAGKETRKKIKDFAVDGEERFEHMGAEAKQKAINLIIEGKERLSSQKDRLEAAFEAGKKAYEKKQQVQA